MDYRKLNNELQNLMQKAMAWDAISTKSDETHDYCRLNKVGLLGENVWHAILADAIRMRKELEASKRAVDSERDFPHSNTDMGS